MEQRQITNKQTNSADDEEEDYYEYQLKKNSLIQNSDTQKTSRNVSQLQLPVR